MHLRIAIESDLQVLIGWFKSGEDARSWAGPQVRYPLVMAQLKEDIRWCTARQFALVNGDELFGFVQLFDRYGCQHIGQVAIHPNSRGQGLGRVMLTSLFKHTEKNQKNYSLFVFNTNIAAIKLYDSLGFEPRPIPFGEQHPEYCEFMVRKNN